MSIVRSQALINAPPSRIWELVGDPRRHPEWWPRVVEVRGVELDEGSEYVQVTREPTGRMETVMSLDRLEDLREIHLHCTKTGTYAHWQLTEAQGNTFVDVEFGMDPIGVSYRIFDATVGKLAFSRWLAKALASLEKAAESPLQASANL